MPYNSKSLTNISLHKSSRLYSGFHLSNLRALELSPCKLLTSDGLKKFLLFVVTKFFQFKFNNLNTFF